VKASTVINEARVRGVSIYVIHIPLFAPRGGRLGPRPTTKGFRDLAQRTGGRYFMAGDRTTALEPQAKYDLTPILQAIEEDLQGQYVLGYYATDDTRGVQLHLFDVALTLPDKRKLRVNAVHGGYTLKPQNHDSTKY
jgi:hypothetical protein